MIGHEVAPNRPASMLSELTTVRSRVQCSVADKRIVRANLNHLIHTTLDNINALSCLGKALAKHLTRYITCAEFKEPCVLNNQ